MHASSESDDAFKGGGCTLPFWAIVTITTVLSVLFPVLLGLVLVTQNSNDILGETQLGSVSANASGLSQLLLERVTTAEGVAHYIASYVRFAENPIDYDSELFFDMLSQALFSFNMFVAE